jgi:hypothetical protein
MIPEAHHVILCLQQLPECAYISKSRSGEALANAPIFVNFVSAIWPPQTPDWEQNGSIGTAVCLLPSLHGAKCYNLIWGCWFLLRSCHPFLSFLEMDLDLITLGHWKDWTLPEWHLFHSLSFSSGPESVIFQHLLENVLSDRTFTCLGQGKADVDFLLNLFTYKTIHCSEIIFWY